jgi:hypothetical protein
MDGGTRVMSYMQVSIILTTDGICRQYSLKSFLLNFKHIHPVAEVMIAGHRYTSRHDLRVSHSFLHC